MHDEFHTASFTCTVFPIAMLSEVAPFPVAACKPVLVEETHVLTCLSEISFYEIPSTGGMALLQGKPEDVEVTACSQRWSSELLEEYGHGAILNGQLDGA